MKETAPTQRTTGSDNNKKKNNEEKVKKPRPSASRLADEILLMVKKSREKSRWEENQRRETHSNSPINSSCNEREEDSLPQKRKRTNTRPGGNSE